jgi:hypothetical protein
LIHLALLSDMRGVGKQVRFRTGRRYQDVSQGGLPASESATSAILQTSEIGGLLFDLGIASAVSRANLTHVDDPS